MSYPLQFHTPFKKKMPPSFSEADRQPDYAQHFIKTEVLPAFHRFCDFMQEDYVPASFEQVGAWQVPNGGATYAYLARAR
jgi:uncharacterized protein (DUF885 family)